MSIWSFIPFTDSFLSISAPCFKINNASGFTTVKPSTLAVYLIISSAGIANPDMNTITNLNGILTNYNPPWMSFPGIPPYTYDYCRATCGCTAKNNYISMLPPASWSALGWTPAFGVMSISNTISCLIMRCNPGMLTPAMDVCPVPPGGGAVSDYCLMLNCPL